MREFKFRAWDKFNKVMTYSEKNYPLSKYSIEFNWKNNNKMSLLMLIDPRYGEMREFDADIMQYTGLIDKNGKEIYEGDIVRHFKRDKEKLLKIEISSGYGVYAQEKDTTKRLIGRSNTHLYYEVVGNIYENPELLG